MATKKTKKSGSKKGTTNSKGGRPKAAKKPKAKIAKAKTTSESNAKSAKPKRLSAIDAAAEVLRKSKEPMRSRELITAMEEQGLWTSPGGRTPWATLYAALIREIAAKGKDARFTKTDRGLFALNGKGK